MSMKKKILPRLIIWAIVLGLLASLVYFVFIPMYTQTEESFGETPEIHGYSGDGKQITMESDRLLFKMDPTTTMFDVTDKKTGKVWYSNPQDRAKDPIAMGVNSQQLSSTLNVTYTTSGGEVELNNYTYSMENQTYDVVVNEDGSVTVNYAIGKIEKEYIIPTAITKERWDEFTGNMSKSNKKKVSSNYTTSDPAKLDKADNKNEILALCPSAADTYVYLLKSSATSDNKAMVEACFREAGYTREDYEIDSALITEITANNGPVFNASVTYRLEGDDMVVTVPYTSLRCEDSAPLTYISVLPMFGAAGTSQEGFMLVPEGGGALINYNNGKTTQSAYYANLYGWDYATERTEVVNETKSAFPVFGMATEGSSFICIMDGASAYGSISADVAGRFNSYNTVYGKYKVLHYDKFNVSGRTAQLLYMYEKAIPDDTLVQRYRFIDSDDYAAMAAAYGDYLMAKDEMAGATASEDVPVHVELVAAINKVVAKLGLPIDSVVATTTFDQAEQIMNELVGSGVANLNLRMTGWSNGGIRQKVLTSVKTVGEIGGDKGMKKLNDAAGKAGVQVSYDGISCFAYDSGIPEGFFAFSNAARLTTREQAKLYNFDVVTYKRADWQDAYYLVRPDYAQKMTSNLISALGNKGVKGIAFRDIGNLLSADYYNKATVTRQQVLNMNVNSLREAVKAGLRVTIKSGNDYAVPYADLITDMNLTGSAYTILDRQVPFYQIALHGHKDYTGEAINLAGDYQTQLLKAAEYGAGLNFTFMKEDTLVLRDTMYSCYTAAAYDRWKDQLLPAINRYQSEMSGLNRQSIVKHEYLDERVTATTYADGTTVYVNYGYADYKADGVAVAARDYKVERGTSK